MDAFTAATALIITLLCVALVMTGVYFAAPPENCSRYWALSTIAIACGVSLIVINVGAPHAALQFFGSNCLIWGAILQCWGVQAFYRQAPGKAGWVIGAAFFLLFGLAIAASTSISTRLLIFFSTLLIILTLTAVVLWRNLHSHRTLGSVLTLSALAILIVNNGLRILSALAEKQDFVPLAHSSSNVGILYLIPIGGIFLYATGILLLVFERLVDEKNHVATHDDLTGALNARAVAASGEREVAVSIRNRLPLTIALVEVDFFARAHDNLARGTGDAILVQITQLLKQTCRYIDLIGRYQPEQFCIIFPGVDQDCAAILGERLLTAARQHRFPHQHPVTISIGLASLPDNLRRRSWNDMTQRANSALDQAKALGRDRFCIALHEPAITTGTEVPAGDSAQPQQSH